MIQYPEISPVIVSLGPIDIRWYGVMYLLGFLAALWVGRRRAALAWTPLEKPQVEDLVFYGALGAVLGGRVGYVFFYGFEKFLADPIWLFKIWEGGMAFHGGLLGVFLALALMARRIGQPIGAVADFVAPMAPIGLGLGRLANFINGELWGRPTDVPWAMKFPGDDLGLARHPSQLYQAFLEGVVLLLVVWWFARKPRPNWSVAAVFILTYGVARFVVEFFRQPDIDASLAFEWMTRGQLLSTPMIVGGIILLVFAYSRASGCDPAATAGQVSTAAGVKDGIQAQPRRKQNKKSARKRRNRKR